MAEHSPLTANSINVFVDLILHKQITVDRQLTRAYTGSVIVYVYPMCLAHCVISISPINQSISFARFSTINLLNLAFQYNQYHVSPRRFINIMHLLHSLCSCNINDILYVDC